MSATKIAIRYAKALYRLFDEKWQLAEQMRPKIAGVEELFQHKESGRILMSPIMPASLKLELLKHGLAVAGADKVLFGFFEALVEAGRVDMVPDILAAFDQLVKDAQGIALARVVSATEMTAEQKQRLEEKVSKTISKKVQATYTTDKSLLGGFVVHVGNLQMDMSVQSRLQGLAEQALGE
jgi:F-type H+-transporting ATPase subunit delta